MASAAVAKAPPAGVSKTAMWGKLKSQANKLEKYKEGAVHFGEVIGLAAVGGGTALATGFLFKKMPDWKTIPGTEIPTQPVVGGAFILLAAVKKTKMSYLLMAIGIGILLPYLFDLGDEIEIGG